MKTKVISHLSPGPIFIILAGMFFLIKGYQSYSLGVQSEAWLAVDAHVIQSKIRQNRSLMKRPPSYDFTYRYTVKGKVYTSNRYHFKTGSNYQAVSSHQTGDQITAWYNPNQPSEATIIKSESMLNYIWMLVGLISVVVGIIWGIKERRTSV